MKKNRAGWIIKVTALICVLIFALGILIYGLRTDFGITDFIKTIDNGIYTTAYTYEEEVRTLRGIDVDWVAGPVTLEFYDGETVKVIETAKTELNEDEKLYLEVSGGKLSVRWNSALLVGIFRDAPKQLEILIPKTFADGLESVSIETVSGDIALNGISAGEVSFKSISGELRLANITAEHFKAKTTSGNILCENIIGSEELKASSNSGVISFSNAVGGLTELDNTSGEIVLTGTLAELECGSVSGDVRFDLSAWPQKVDIHTVSGDVDILAPETEEGFLCSFSSVSGDFSSDFRTQKSGKLYQCGEGIYQLKLETTSGDVTLNQKVG